MRELFLVIIFIYVISGFLYKLFFKEELDD